MERTHNPHLSLRRLTALVLCLVLVLTLVPLQALASEEPADDAGAADEVPEPPGEESLSENPPAEDPTAGEAPSVEEEPPVEEEPSSGYTVTFVDYDLSSLDGSYTLPNVPAFARLYTAEELEAKDVPVPAAPGCTYYLYYAGGDGVASYGPEPIADPVREGYEFRDWVNLNASGDDIYTVTGDTTFVARYVSESQYVISLYYQFDTGAVAAETTTTPYGWEDPINMQLPQLASLTPTIDTSLEGDEAQNAKNLLNSMLSGGAFTGTLDAEFLEACKTLGFVAWDEADDSYVQDENGNVAVDIPVTYVLADVVSFTVRYHLQDAEQPETYILQEEDTATGTVTGTTQVHLWEEELVKEYTGFTLTEASAENADSFSVSVDGSSFIDLYYDCNVHYVYYAMDGGTARDPVARRFGQSLEDLGLTDHPIRPGYTFAGWEWYQGTTLLEDPPASMPDEDLTLVAKWTADKTEVTLVYWLENANDENYTAAASTTISVTAGQTVGYDIGEGSQSTVDVAINNWNGVNYTSLDYIRDTVKISDIDYFTLSPDSIDASTKYDLGIEGGPKVAAGDSSTVINIGFTRNEYTLVFHLGKQDYAINNSGEIWSYISTGGFSQPTWETSIPRDPADWLKGEFTWTAGGMQASMTIGDVKYTIGGNYDDTACYQITAKYGAFISDQWPTYGNAEFTTVTQDGKTYQFFTWGTNHQSPYYEKHDPDVVDSEDNRGNPNIIGVYPTMSADLIISPQDPSVEHHLVAYWNASSSHKVHHYLFEVVDGVDTTGLETYDYKDFTTGNGYTPVNVQGAKEDLAGKTFYEFSEQPVYTSQSSAYQNAPAFANVTYQYGYYVNGTNETSGGDVYFLYTYNDYTLTYHENNANLHDSSAQAITKTETFHYVNGIPVLDQLAAMGKTANYTPEQSFVSAYGNSYTFAGWYTAKLTDDATDNERFKVDWDTFAPDSSVDLYAAWNPPTFTLTLKVPGGKLDEDTLEQFTAKGYPYEVEESTVDGETTRIYTVTIPGGIASTDIVERLHGAVSDFGLAFNYWSYTVNGAEQQYLFDPSQLITSDLTLTARWKTTYTGQYTILYLTTEHQENGYETVTIGDTLYYRLLPDETVYNAAVGTSVTVAAQAVKGYLSTTGSASGVVMAPVNGESKTVFRFYYEKAADDVTYYVHYVRDTGVDYGRTAPPPGVEELHTSKTVIVEMASLDYNTTVSETALVIGGYTPRDSWNTSFVLSGNPSQNHLYIYYVSNTITEKFTVYYHIQDDTGTYGAEPSFTLTGSDALGKVLTVQNLTSHYDQYLSADEAAELGKMLVGHTVDPELTQEKYLLLIDNPAANVLHIYLKNADYTVTYYLNGDDAAWENPDPFLTGAGGGNSYAQTVVYPTAAAVPTTIPVRLGYAFTGWNTEADGTGEAYTVENLAEADWYTHHGLTGHVDLYAQWEPQLKVAFQLRSGTWTDHSGNFHEIDGTWTAYVTKGEQLSPPSAPELTQGSVAYSFIGWTTTDPAQDAAFIDQNNRVDLALFQEEYSFDFTQPIDKDTVLYAVWDPDVTTVSLTKTDTRGVLLAGAVFTLERLQSTVTGNGAGGYTFEPVLANGGYVADVSFPIRTVTSDGVGSQSFQYLPAGYYRLTEKEAPAGYQGLTEPVILFLPYGGTPEVVGNPVSVLKEVADGDLLLTVQNAAQYNVTIDAPDTLTFTYEPPDLIWNPELLQYEGPDGTWTTDPAAQIKVTNRSIGGSVNVEVTLQYDEGYAALLPLSSLTELSGDFEAQRTEDTLSGVYLLEKEAEATFSLVLSGRPDAALVPSTEQKVGTLTIRVTPASG